MNELQIIKNGEVKIKSIDLVDIINKFREVESNKTKLRHSDFMVKIRKEIETLKNAGIANQRNFSVVKYIDLKGEKRPCFELNRDGTLQMLNSESALVRYKTIEYINKLENKVKNNLPRTYKEALLALVAAEEEKEKMQLESNKQKQIIGELRPKADYTDRILKNKGLVTITQIAKDYGFSGTYMNRLLHDLEVQYKQNNQWLLYSKHQSKGYTHSHTISFIRSDGNPDVKMNTKWTQKGRLFLYNLLKKNGILPIIEQ